jgi:hypothetical protein
MPVNYLLIESLQKFHHYYGDDFKVECPTGSGQFMHLKEIANELSNRLIKIWLRDQNGDYAFARASGKSVGEAVSFPNASPARTRYLFHEYFHGDTGAGLGASHQTGWTGLVAKLIQQQGEFGTIASAIRLPTCNVTLARARLPRRSQAKAGDRNRFDFSTAD